MWFIILLVVVGGLYYLFTKYAADRKAEELARIKKTILPHARTLAIKYNQLVYQDDYGNYIFDDWEKEAEYFIDNVLLKDDLTYQFLIGGGTPSENNARVKALRDLVFDVAIEEALKMVG